MLVLFSVFPLLLAGCMGPGATNPPPDSTSTTDPWKNLPVVSTDGSGTIGEQGGIIRLGEQDIELQIPRGMLAPGEEVSITIQEVDLNPQVFDVSALSGTSYAPKALQLSVDATSDTDVLARLVLGNETEQARFVYNAINSNQSMIVESLFSVGSDMHVVSTFVDGQKVISVFDLPSARLASDSNPVPGLLSSRAMLERDIRERCGDGYVSLKEGDHAGAFPASEDTDQYLCRPLGENVIWDRVAQQRQTKTYEFPATVDGANGAVETVKLITANVGNVKYDDYNYKLADAVTAQRIYNNLKLLSPDIVLLQELYDGSQQAQLLLPDGYTFVCPEYPSGNRYECIAWRTDKFTQTGSSKAITGESFPGEWAFEDADDFFTTDYCSKKDGSKKDTGGVWTMLESNTLGISAFKVLSVHTATSGVENSAYCREEQLLTFLKQLDIAKCTTCNTDSGNSDSPTRKWEKVETTRAIIAGDFNIDPDRGGAMGTRSDQERFKWVVDWTRSLGSQAAPDYDKDEGTIDPSDLNELVALRTDTNYTTSYLLERINKSLDHLLVTGKVDEMGTPGDVSDDKLRSNLIDSAYCVVLNGEGGHHALSEDWWVSSDSDQSGMDHYAVACKLGFHSATSPSFSLALDPANLSAQQGGSAQTTLTITPQNGFTGTVSLSLEKQDGSPAPSGITISPSSASVSGSSSINQPLTISVDSSVAAGALPLRVVGTSGSTSAYADFSLTVSGGSDGGGGSDGTQWTWRAGPLSSVTYGNNTFVTVGDNGTILTSPDGVNWTAQSSGTSEWLYAVTYGNNTFVAVGYSGTVLTSPDGVNWTAQSSGAGSVLYAVTYGNGTFVAVGYGGTILTSPDGASWTAQSSGTGSVLRAVTYGNGTFVAVGSGGTILTSPDGANWTLQSSGTRGTLIAVTYGNGTFVAVGIPGTALTSPDGVNWTLQRLGTNSVLEGVTYGNNTLVSVGSGGTILTSPDGVNWTVQSLGAVWLKGVTYGNGTFVAVGYGSTIFTSPDGVNWTAQSSESGGDRLGTTYGNNTFVSVGSGGTILTSPDGANWTAQSSGTSESLYAVTYGNGTFVAVGYGGTILTSPDGVNWTVQSLGAVWLKGVTYGNGTFVAVGYGSTIFTSPDGVNWTAQSSGTGNRLFGVTYGNGTFVSVGSGGTILTSPDGASWTAQSSGTISVLDAVTYGNGTFVAVGSSDTILTSPDGVGWTVQRLRAGGSNLSDVTYGNGTFVAVGYGGTILTSP